jgi:hypothetical protein
MPRRRPDLYCPADFGLTEEQHAAVLARRAPTVAEIAAMIVDEADLARLGRWRGLPAPRRALPGR